MNDEIPLISLAQDGPTIMLAVGLYFDDPFNPPRSTILGIGTDYEALKSSVHDRLFRKPGHDTLWGRKDPDAPDELDGGFEEILIVEVPADAAVMELTLQGSKLMRAAIERQRAAQETAVPRI